MAALTSLSLPQPENLTLSLMANHSIYPPATANFLEMCHYFQEVRQVHAQMIVSGLLRRRSNSGKLLKSYVTVSQLNYAISVFENIPWPDVFAYNTMIRGLILSKSLYESLLMYKRFLSANMTPDNYTYTFVLKACSHLEALGEGKQVHGQIIKAGIPPHTHVHSSLIHMYTKSGRIECAERVLLAFAEENTVAKNSIISGYMNQGHVEKARSEFDEMEAKDVATWSAIISGYVKNGMYLEALNTYQEMIAMQVPPNESTLVSSLSACAYLGALDQGKWIHRYIMRRSTGIRLSTTIGTALIEMYAKCGSIECGYLVFQEMPHNDKDIVTWGAMISGFALYGEAQKCIQLFDELIGSGTRPNGVIFVSILSACSHAGFIELGFRYFDQMVNKFGIRPSVEHYGCMVDLLSRAGLLVDAEQLIVSMTEEKPNSIIWGAFLSACRTYNDTRRGNWALMHLTQLEEPNRGDRYKLAGLMFSNAGKTEDATKIRKFVKQNNLETTLGKSSIEVNGVVHEFIAGDINHEETREIYNTLEGCG